MFATFPPLEALTLTPLQPNDGEDGADSDHLVTYITAVVTGREANPWVTHTYRPVTESGKEAFREWVLNESWESVLSEEGSNSKAEAYQRLVGEAMDRCFPIRTVRRRKQDPPWMNNEIRRLESARKKLFKRAGRTGEWRELSTKLETLKAERRGTYLEQQRTDLTDGNLTRQF